MKGNIDSSTKLVDVPSSIRLSKPNIGIIICGVEQERQFVTDTYIRSVQCAGGLPVVIPFVRSHAAIKQYACLCDGFMFCGGGDISSLLFGQQPISISGSSDLKLDIFQIRLMQSVLKTQRPVLAVCRGMQVLNVALGGSIYQDLSMRRERSSNHMQVNVCREDPSHMVRIKHNTQLHRILNSTTVFTNSYHHQAVHGLGKGLIASAHSADHVIEAIELPGHPFALGVQWHPECMIAKSKAMQSLFLHFLRLC